MREQFRLLTGMPGIAQISAVQILGELVLLAPDLTARQWVAAPGWTRCMRIPAPRCINRRASAARQPPPAPRALHAGAVGGTLGPAPEGVLRVPAGAAQEKLQALIAVARKMLHAIYGIFKTRPPTKANSSPVEYRLELKSLAR